MNVLKQDVEAQAVRCSIEEENKEVAMAFLYIILTVCMMNRMDC